MCLTNITTKKPFVAQQNIFCWKQLHKKISLHQYYKYEIGVLQQDVLLIIHNNTIRQGYHSWKNMYNTYTKRINKHLFLIPKGTEYFEGLENEESPGYVSSNIIYLGHWLSPMTWLRAYKYKNK